MTAKKKELEELKSSLEPKQNSLKLTDTAPTATVDPELEARFKTVLNEPKQLQFEFDASSLEFQKQIDVYQREIEQMSEVIQSLRKDLDRQQNSGERKSLFVAAQADAVTSTGSINRLAQEIKEKASILPAINQKPNENMKVSKRSFLLQAEQSNIMFTRLDAVQNLKRLRGGVLHGKVSEDAMQVTY